MVKINDSNFFKDLWTADEDDFPTLIKWGNITIGTVLPNGGAKFDLTPVTLAKLDSNSISWLMFLMDTPDLVYEWEWDPEEFKVFLEERLPSRHRRDIDKLLIRCGLVSYDVLKLAASTRAFNARDVLWLAFNESEKMEEVIPLVFKYVFIRKVDFDGGSVNSPEGANIKRYAVDRNRYGILKKRLHPYSTDVESEVAVKNLGNLMGVPVCDSWLVEIEDDFWSFSKFEYDFSQEIVVHFRRAMKSRDLSGNLYQDLIRKFPEFKTDIQKMILLDFVTRQTDRHLSNMALLLSGSEVYFYPLYDNGRSLFFEDTKEFMSKAVEDIFLYSESFGSVGTYYDVVQEISKDVDVSSIVDINLSETQIRRSYADIPRSRRGWCVQWTMRCLEFLRTL